MRGSGRMWAPSSRTYLEEVYAAELGVVQVAEDAPPHRRGVDRQDRLVGPVGKVKVQLR